MTAPSWPIFAIAILEVARRWKTDRAALIALALIAMLTLAPADTDRTQKRSITPLPSVAPPLTEATPDGGADLGPSPPRGAYVAPLDEDTDHARWESTPSILGGGGT